MKHASKHCVVFLFLAGCKRRIGQLAPCCWRAMFTLKRRCCHAQHGQRKSSWQGAMEEAVRLCSSKSTQDCHAGEEGMLVAQSSQPGSKAERPSPAKEGRLKGAKPKCQAANWSACEGFPTRDFRTVDVATEHCSLLVLPHFGTH